MKRVVEEQKAEAARQSLAKLICYENVAPRSFCAATFDIFHALDPNNQKLSCLDFGTLESNCLKIYNSEQHKVKDIFSKLGGKISLLVDLLIHENQGDHYLCLTAQFIDNDWKLQNWVIKYCHVFDGAILKALKEFDIESKILSLTAGGTNGLADMVKEVQEQVKLPKNGQLFHVQCSCDIITKMVQNGLQEISKIIDKVRLLRSEPLWYLTTFKLSEAMKLEEIGELSTVVDEDNNNEVPSKEEWDKVKSVCRIVDRIYEITKGLFEIRKPTPNLFLPHFQEIWAYLANESTNSDAFVRLVAQKMLMIFDKYLDDMHFLLSITAFLDPRFKMKFIEFYLSDSRTTIDLERIREVYHGYVVLCDQKEYPFSDSSSESEEEEDEIEERSETPAKVKRRDILENLGFVKEYCQSMQSMHSEAPMSDLDLYLEEPILPWTGNFSVLHWWKDKRVKYPQLSKMARDFLAIPLSVATSYDAYYTEPRLTDSTLSCLKPELTNALKCTRSWRFGATKKN